MAACTSVAAASRLLERCELQHKARVALAAVRSDQFQTRNLHELAFEGRRHVIRHGFRCGAGITHLHLNYGIVNRGKIVNGKTAIRQDAKENGRGGQHRRHYRTANKWLGDIHGCALSFAPGAPAPVAPAEKGCVRTLAPGLRVNCPVTTTLSPAASPFETTTSSPWRWPSVTGRSSTVLSGFGDVNERALLGHLRSLIRNQNGPFLSSEHEPHVYELAGPEMMIGIRNRGSQVHGSGAVLHGVVKECELAGCGRRFRNRKASRTIAFNVPCYISFALREGRVR